MDFDGMTDGFGSRHYANEYDAGLERLRYIKTPQEGNAKWVASTSQGEQAWVDGLNRTTKPIVASALAARSKALANYGAALQPGGVWERHLSNVGDAGIKAAAQAKRSNYSTGVSQASSKQLAALTKIIAYETSALNQLSPKSGTGSGRTRMNEWFDLMSAARGTLGAES